MVNNEELQQKYIEMQTLDAQIKHIQEQVQTLEAQIDEMKIIISSLDDFKGVKEGSKILAPISSGIFLKAKLDTSSELLVNVGSETVVKKSVDEVKELLDEQIEHMKKAQSQLVGEFQKNVAKAMQLEKELSQMVSD